MRQREKHALASYDALPERRKAKAITPEASAASCKRRDGVSGNRTSSPTTPARPPCHSPSSIAGNTSASFQVSQQMTRSGCRPTRARAGANRSRLCRHQVTGPGRRARMPAANSPESEARAVRPLPSDFMYGTQGETATGQRAIDRVDAEGQRSPFGARRAEALELAAKFGKS
jgi:hypothetical protein